MAVWYHVPPSGRPRGRKAAGRSWAIPGEVGSAGCRPWQQLQVESPTAHVLGRLALPLSSRCCSFWPGEASGSSVATRMKGVPRPQRTRLISRRSGTGIATIGADGWWSRRRNVNRIWRGYMCGGRPLPEPCVTSHRLVDRAPAQALVVCLSERKHRKPHKSNRKHCIQLCGRRSAHEIWRTNNPRLRVQRAISASAPQHLVFHPVSSRREVAETTLIRVPG